MNGQLAFGAFGASTVPFWNKGGTRLPVQMIMVCFASRVCACCRVFASDSKSYRFRSPLNLLVPVLLAGFGLVFALVLALAGTIAMPGAASAANTNFQRSYIDPFPKGDRYRVVVLGDSLGDGLWSGLYRSFQDDKNMEVVRRSKISTGLVRTDVYNWNKELKKILKQDDKYEIAVVMFGANDDQPIREDGKWYAPGTDGWRKIYGERVEEFLKTLRSANIAAYWVGLPIMQSRQMNANAGIINDIVREKCFIYGTKFIETSTGFTDESGHYSAYGPDMSGQMRRLRASDGIHFTSRGYLKLAHFVEKEIRRDLAVAKQERNIPLAGDVAEQSRVMGHKVVPGNNSGDDGHAISPGKPDGHKSDGQQHVEAPAAPKLEQSVVAGVELLRPVISQSTLDATRALAPQSASATGVDGETVAAELGDGLTALSSISAVSDLSLVSSKPRLPLAERPYYRVLVKGEQLKPRQGRADDFSWPLH